MKNNKKKSFVKKYGVENPSQLESIKKIKKQIYINSHIKKYGVLPDERNLYGPSKKTTISLVS